MKSCEVRLDFPLERISEPIVTYLVKKYDVAPNVLAADIDASKGGWLVLGLIGEEQRVGDALTWVQSQGVKVTIQ